MRSTIIRRWAWMHKWSSLICTIFMLLLCLTGLPLIFHHQIDHLLGNVVEAPEMSAPTPKANIDHVIAAAQALYPHKVMQYVSRDIDNDKIWNVTLGDSVTDPAFNSVAVDARSAKVLAEPKFEGTFIYLMYRLHVDLFAGLAGSLFLGLMGLLLIVAIVSGAVLYAPFMRKFEFGTVRRERASRIAWLDLHNLLGIVTLVWTLVVGATGVINTGADLLLKYWQVDQMAQMVAPYKNLPVPTRLASLQQSMTAAQALEPTMNFGFIAFPGTAFTSPHHYGIFMRGREALTARLYKPVLVDAETARITDSRTLPWYLTALLVSQPLHFGDYGGLAMQVLWALLDLATILVLGSGVYIWLKRGARAHDPLRDRRLSEGNLIAWGARARSTAASHATFSCGSEALRHSFKTVWAWPIALGLATVIGLLSALLGDGLWNGVSALALSLPVVVGGWYGLRKTPAVTSRK